MNKFKGIYKHNVLTALLKNSYNIKQTALKLKLDKQLLKDYIRYKSIEIKKNIKNITKKETIPLRQTTRLEKLQAMKTPWFSRVISKQTEDVE